MFRLFKHYVPYTVLFLALIDMALLLCAANAAWLDFNEGLIAHWGLILSSLYLT